MARALCTAAACPEILGDNGLDGIRCDERLIEVVLGQTLPLQGKPRSDRRGRSQGADCGNRRTR